MTFSVVIPVHNKEAYIARSIESVLAQEFQDFEILVVEDASTDASARIIESLVDDRITIIKRFRPGPGGYLARNEGADKAIGDWIVFLDADDEWDRNHLSTLDELISKYPKADFLATGYRVCDGRRVKEVHVPYECSFSPCKALKRILHVDYIHTNSTCIRRSLYKRVEGFNTKMGWKRGGDTEFWLRLISSARETAFSDKVTTTWKYDRSEITRANIPHDLQHPVITHLNSHSLSGFIHCQGVLKSYVFKKWLTWEVLRSKGFVRILWIAILVPTHPIVSVRFFVDAIVRGLSRIW
ncbi:glycosyltransferase family 2 protein [Maritimibacter sp. HL-12]|uniref:glycosyltransferase family 2 protein n=1 Tax=Maritimibacter sp. HL-12 TaxID=1162418 RepID=UPI000A0F045B|nr:glycosyltransferase family 2 protein [Maritimibacter sp. HL-12]SMH56166.1 Glycosyltransferases involved in cell wall biogenesis [Maritimibacter sp. HL-12]